MEMTAPSLYHFLSEGLKHCCLKGEGPEGLELGVGDGEGVGVGEGLGLGCDKTG